MKVQPYTYIYPFKLHFARQEKQKNHSCADFIAEELQISLPTTHLMPLQRKLHSQLIKRLILPLRISHVHIPLQRSPVQIPLPKIPLLPLQRELEAQLIKRRIQPL